MKRIVLFAMIISEFMFHNTNVYAAFTEQKNNSGYNLFEKTLAITSIESIFDEPKLIISSIMILISVSIGIFALVSSDKKSKEPILEERSTVIGVAPTEIISSPKQSYYGETEFIPKESVEFTVKLYEINIPDTVYERVLSSSTEIVIGRDSLRCDIVIDSERSISGCHCRLYIDASEDVMIEDLGSRNGTLVNGANVSKPQILYSGDELKLGRSKFRIELRKME